MPDFGSPVRRSHPIALVPVGLKEAALDSPSFRSGVSHFADQVDLVEKWLDTWMRSVSKITHEVGPLESTINGFLSQMLPPANVSEAVLDHDYTFLALKRYADAAREIWTSTIQGMMKMEVNMVEPVRSFVQTDLRAFKDVRRSLELTQKAFDGLLYRYSAQSKTKEPSSLREDAFQLHEARKAYLKASMDFSVLAPQFRMTLDKVLVKVFSDQWRDLRTPKGALNAGARRWNNDIERVRSWSHEMENGEAAFCRELRNARKQIEDTAEIRSRPSRELEDYSNHSSPTVVSTAPATAADVQNGVNQNFMKAEKQGWLYLRTLSGKPARTIWVRRWFFVKNGIFGWLVQSSRSVIESDRIGVLLCNVRPVQSEERRFAFEVKTKDLSIVLQADSQAELLEWMQAFQIAKQKALEDPGSTDSPGFEGPSQDPAFAISSPPAPEFAASAADSGLNQLRDDNAAAANLERGSTLPLPGAETGLGLPLRSSTDIGGHRRSIAGDREGESGREHAARIIQKLDLHRKSTGGPQVPANAGGPPSNPPLAGGGIASLIAASHNVMPVGPGNLPLSPPREVSSKRSGGASEFRDMPPTSLAPSTLVNAPVPTDLSAMAVIISGERGINLGRPDATGGMPSGVMANIWGSSAWGYLNRLERGEVQVPQSIPVSRSPDLQSHPVGTPPKTPLLPAALTEKVKSGTPPSSHRKTTSLPVGINTIPNLDTKAIDLPKSYPLQLKTQDAQFRLLFPNVSRYERVVLVFRATWSLNEQQEFPGRVYVTVKHMYFYSHHIGLVLTSGIGLDSISEVTAAPGREYDLLFIHLKENSEINDAPRITVKAFLEPLKILQQRLDYLIKTCAAGQQVELDTIMTTLLEFEQGNHTQSPLRGNWDDFTATATSDEGRVGRSDLYNRDQHLRAAVMFDAGSFGGMRRAGEGNPSTKIKLPRQPVLYVPTGMRRAVVDKVYDISPKALFHVLFGDKSAIWQLLYHERQAQPLDLTDLITDQVRKLGAQSRTKKAVQIFGQVGVQTHALEFAGSDAPISPRVRRSVQRRSMAWLLASLIASFAQAVCQAIMRCAFGLVRWVWKTLNANMVILAVLATSAIVNLIFSSNTTAEWWRDRRAGNYLARVGIGSDMMMSKAVYIQDLKDMWASPVGWPDESQSACYLGMTEMDGSETVMPSTQASLGRLQRSRRRLGSQRHDLMVALRVINSIEQEMVETEWERWLYAESANCGQMGTLISQNRTESSLGNGKRALSKKGSGRRLDWSEVRSWHKTYCGSCSREKESWEAAQE
ncbi:MAG: hypothetical protein L6R37_003102 [Teloschistes peruensis]|nr:MAG: hypothetical protein L6R37_003102 [Teloschistes peruensis]